MATGQLSPLAKRHSGVSCTTGFTTPGIVTIQGWRSTQSLPTIFAEQRNQIHQGEYVVIPLRKLWTAPFLASRAIGGTKRYLAGFIVFNTGAVNPLRAGRRFGHDDELQEMLQLIR